MSHELKLIALINLDYPLHKFNTGMVSMFDKHKEKVNPWAVPSLSLLTIASLTPIEIDFIDERFETLSLNYAQANQKDSTY